LCSAKRDTRAADRIRLPAAVDWSAAVCQTTLIGQAHQIRKPAASSAPIRGPGAKSFDKIEIIKRVIKAWMLRRFLMPSSSAAWASITGRRASRFQRSTFRMPASRSKVSACRHVAIQIGSGDACS